MILTFSANFLFTIALVHCGVSLDREDVIFAIGYLYSWIKTFPPEYQLPWVVLAATGDAEYFPVGVKHRYTRK
jgi:hypothetical protein